MFKGLVNPNCAATIAVWITLLVNLTKFLGNKFSGMSLSNTFGGVVQTTSEAFNSTVLPAISANTPVALPFWMIISLTLALVKISPWASLTALVKPSTIKRCPGAPAKAQEPLFICTLDS